MTHLQKICLINVVGAVLSMQIHLSSHKCSFIIIMLSLYRYFKPIQKVPDPNGPLSSLVPTLIIQQVNIEVLNVVEKTHREMAGRENHISSCSAHAFFIPPVVLKS